ncbi:TetR/AcrR family transcriptional regulator [Roseomonas sp. JC162]|uniref:TetR/AcrR family transcriptional regulator n=1 Tax=Neoroseomonas marina TaxID=1232220 RepID=A0A848EB35_9PROT|nr:TetR/AcrR family transcriptional regulator [Neoroseomonas marina]NMJ40757.1 TetR/AcrR family transcriptional regulator [Neoroseomonas marina]
MMDATATNAPGSARTRILDAAERIVQAKGVGGLTLDAAARGAGVSKGGLLYHFASKEALIGGMLERYAEFCSASFDATVARQGEGRGRVARAFIAWAFGEEDTSPGTEQTDRLAAVCLAAFHHDPALLDPMRAVAARMKAELLADGTPTGAALAVLTASDGLFMAHIFKLYRHTDAERAALRATLEALLASSA